MHWGAWPCGSSVAKASRLLETLRPMIAEKRAELHDSTVPATPPDET
jgi:hypothetical protein